MTEIDSLSIDFASRYPDSFCRILGRGDVDQSSRVIEKLPSALKASIIARLPAPRIEQLLMSDRHDPRQWLMDASFDDALALLSRIPREARLSLIKSLNPGKLRQSLLRHQQYPEHCVGSLAREIWLQLRDDSMAENALKEIRDLHGEDPGPILVVDAEGRYRGVVDRWRLIVDGSPTGRIRDYTVEVSPLRPETPIAAAAMSDVWNVRRWVPVVDHRGRVLGGVTRATILNAARLQADSRHGAGNTFVILAADLVHVFGSLLHQVLAGRRVS